MEKPLFTPESLLQIAAEAEVEYRALLKLHPPGTSNKERNDAYDRREKALLCADWMEKNGFKELSNVGPFMNTQLKKGDEIKVRKGAVIFSTHPSAGQKGTEAKRDQIIRVHSFDPGFVDTMPGAQNGNVRQGRVTWPGTGGYWRWTDINNTAPIKNLGGMTMLDGAYLISVPADVGDFFISGLGYLCARTPNRITLSEGSLTAHGIKTNDQIMGYATLEQRHQAGLDITTPALVLRPPASPA